MQDINKTQLARRTHEGQNPIVKPKFKRWHSSRISMGDNKNHLYAIFWRYNKLCGRPPQYAPPLQADLWPFDLLTLKVVSESCVTRATSANFSLPKPLCSRLRPDVRDRQTPGVRRASSLNVPTLGAGRNNQRCIAFWENSGVRFFLWKMGIAPHRALPSCIASLKKLSHIAAFYVYFFAIKISIL